MRLFVAIELTEPVRSALVRVQNKLMKRCNGVRWIPADQLHVTIKFLGEVSDGTVSDIARCLNQASAKTLSFTMIVGGSGCFPAQNRVRIVWAGVEEKTGALQNGVEEIERALECIGVPRESRPYSPHITLGRVREDRSEGRIRTAVEDVVFDPVEQEVSYFTLMSSVLNNKGPSYQAVSRAKFSVVES